MEPKATRGFQPWDIVKAKIRFHINVVEKIVGVDGKLSLSSTKSIVQNMSGKEFRVSLEEDRLAGVKHTVEIVNQKPETFKLNAIYILADGKQAWVYTEKSKEDEINE